MEFKDRIKQERDKKGLNHSQVAAILGKSEGAVRSWEMGRAKPDTDTLSKLAAYFNVTADYLLGLSDIKNPEHAKLLDRKQEAINSLLAKNDEDILAYYFYYTSALKKVSYDYVIAVDFDGCLCEDEWPEIGAPNIETIARIRAAKMAGCKIILWTCRVGELLERAVKWCAGQGIIFDAVNKNVPERLEFYGSDSRKISADEYWDDRAVKMPSGE